MSSFKFRLQNILDIKVKKEDESKVKYSKVQAEKKLIEEELENLKLSYEKYSEGINVENMLERKLTHSYLNFVGTMIDETNNQLNEKQVLVDKAKDELILSRIERESLEKLKNNKQLVYKKEEERKEQANNDEFGIYSYFRNIAQSV